MSAHTLVPRRPRRLAVSSALFVLCACLVAAVAPAQDWKGRGRLQGSVEDQDGNPIQGATVRIFFRGQEGVGPEPVTTDKKGRWAYMGLSSAPYTLVIEAEGYVPAETQTRLNEYGTGQSRVEVQLRTADSTPSAESERLMGLVAQGNQLMQEGKFAEARTRFEEVIAAVEDEAQKMQLQRAVAGTYLEEGNTAEARARFEPILSATEDPTEKVQLMQSIARSHYMDEDIDQSVAVLEQALAIAPDDTASLRLIVDILVAAGREEDAEPYMGRLPEGEKIDPDALLNLGIAAYNGNDFDTALEKFQAVAAAYPDNADALYYLGLAQMGKAKNDEAKASFQKMLELQPEHPQAAEAQQYLDYLNTL